jgi:hypothetical protein
MGWWDWLSIALGTVGVVAFVMAIQPFIQMMWGAPKLSSEISQYPRDGRYILQFTIWNNPITRGMLRRIGIRRSTAEDVWVSFQILEEPHGLQVFSAMPLINTANGLAAQRVSLPASAIGGHFGIAVTDAKGNVFPGLVPGATEPLRVGSYRVKVDIYLEGRNPTHIEARFIVQDRPPHVYLTN